MKSLTILSFIAFTCAERLEIGFVIDSNLLTEPKISLWKASLPQFFARLGTVYDELAVGGIYNGPAAAGDSPSSAAWEANHKLSLSGAERAQDCFAEFPVKGFMTPSRFLELDISTNAAGDLPTNNHLQLLGAVLNGHFDQATTAYAGRTDTKRLILMVSGDQIPSGHGNLTVGVVPPSQKTSNWERGEITCGDMIPSLSALQAAYANARPPTQVLSLSPRADLWEKLLQEITNQPNRAFDLNLLDVDPENFAKTVAKLAAFVQPPQPEPARSVKSQYSRTKSYTGSTICFIYPTVSETGLTKKEKTGAIVGLVVLAVVLVAGVATTILVDKSRIVS